MLGTDEKCSHTHIRWIKVVDTLTVICPSRMDGRTVHLITVHCQYMTVFVPPLLSLNLKSCFSPLFKSSVPLPNSNSHLPINSLTRLDIYSQLI